MIPHVLKRFIVLEGIDGAGKSTQMNLLFRALSQMGLKVFATREPGGTPIGERIRKILLDKACSDMCLRTEALLYASSRAQLVEQVVKPKVNDGYIVLCERYILSSIAYQAYGAGLEVEAVRQMNTFASKGVVPGLTILIDLDPRFELRARGADRIECRGIDYLDRVRQGYLKLASGDPSIRVVDGRMTIDKVHHEILGLVSAFLNAAEEGRR